MEDVKVAFINGDLDNSETMYIHAPQDFENY